MLILRSKHTQRALIQTMSHFIHLQATYCFACKLGAVLKTPTGLTPKYCQAWISELPSFISLKFHKTLKFIYSEALEFDNTEHSCTHLSHTRSSNCIHIYNLLNEVTVRQSHSKSSLWSAGVAPTWVPNTAWGSEALSCIYYSEKSYIMDQICP